MQVSLPLLAFKNLWRSPLRTVLTLAGVAVAVLAFVFLRTALQAWYAGVDASAQDRLAMRNKVSITLPMPVNYFNKVKDGVPGVSAVTYANWFGGVDPAHEREFFANFAIDTDTYFQVYDELTFGPGELEAWRQDRTGAIVGSALAKKRGWKVGDRITIRGTIYPGDYDFTIRAIYDTTRKSFDKSTVFFHWSYFNERVPVVIKDKIGFIGIRVNDPTRGPEVSRAVDALFQGSDAETLTESERAFNMSFLSMLSAVITALDVVSVVIMIIMGMILANTISMGVRERTHEYGVMRAIGFRPRQVAVLVAGEGALLGLVGGLLGLVIALPVVNGFGKFVEAEFGNFFPYFAVPPPTVGAALGLSLLVGLGAALLPALAASRLRVVEALRRL